MSCSEDNLPTGEYGRSGCLEGSYGRETGEQVLWWGSECATPGTEKTGARRRARNLLLTMAEALSEVPSGWVGTWHQTPQGWEAGAMVQALTWCREETQKKRLSNSGSNTRNPFLRLLAWADPEATALPLPRPTREPKPIPLQQKRKFNFSPTLAGLSQSMYNLI